MNGLDVLNSRSAYYMYSGGKWSSGSTDAHQTCLWGKLQTSDKPEGRGFGQVLNRMLKSLSDLTRL